MKPNIRSSKTFQARALKSRALTILLSIIFLVIVGATAYVLIYKGSNRVSDGTGNSTNLSDIDRNKIIKEVSSKAEALLADNKKEEAISLYDREINLTRDPILKDSFIIEKTNIHLNNEDYLSVTDGIKDITNTGKSSDIEEYLAEAYLRAGDKPQAIAHYQRAIEYMPDDYIMAKGEIEYFEEMIKDIESS